MKEHSHKVANAGGGGVYGLGLIGALVYYLQHAASFGDGVLGILKAIFWPAFLVYHLLAHLQL
ncbi:MAG TPA: hypothetical protein VMT30_06725 [Candidatus Saccharimonadia bacterium]|nr:hypothetical protein [Candidatus Saccharimonadia bacterium]